MKPIFITTILLLMCSHSFGQTQEKSLPASQPSTSVVSDPGFEQYCLVNAARIITVPSAKAINLKISGEVAMQANKQATYRDYGVALKENETQYFTIAGSDQLLAVSSVFRLRTAYNAEQH